MTTALILTLALQSAVPPFATDMYTPAFPRVTAGLDTSASLVGLTLTTFFLGMALGQLLGGPSSDQRGPAEFWVLAPATPTTHLVNDFNALSCAFPVDADLLRSAADVRTRDQGIAEAKSNLDTELHCLGEIGATADGAVGHPDPMKAHRKDPPPNGDSTRSSLSTLPPGVSRWLAWDLPHRVPARTDVPLTVITSRSSAAERFRPRNHRRR